MFNLFMIQYIAIYNVNLRYKPVLQDPSQCCRIPASAAGSKPVLQDPSQFDANLDSTLFGRGARFHVSIFYDF